MKAIRNSRGQEIGVRGGDHEIKSFSKCFRNVEETKPHFVDKEPAVAGEMQGWQML